MRLVRGHGHRGGGGVEAGVRGAAEARGGEGVAVVTAGLGGGEVGADKVGTDSRAEIENDRLSFIYGKRIK